MNEALKTFPIEMLITVIFLMGGALAIVAGMLYTAVQWILKGFDKAMSKVEAKIELMEKDIQLVRIEREAIRRQHPTFAELRDKLKPINLRVDWLESERVGRPLRRQDDPDSGKGEVPDGL